MASSTLDDIDLDELEKLVDSEEDPEGSYSNEIIAFLAAFNIKAGDELVSDWFLYDLYRKWTPNPAWKRLQFKIQLSKLLQSVISSTKNRVTHYKINISGFKLSQRIYELSNAEKPQDPIKKTNYKRHFDSFVKHYNIKAGTYWLPLDALYYIYEDWTRNKLTNVGRQSFHKFAKLYFTEKQTQGTRWYAVDSSILRFIPEEHITQILEGRIKRNEKRQSAIKKGREKAAHKASRAKERSEPTDPV